MFVCVKNHLMDDSWLRRSWEATPTSPAETLVIAFAGFDGRLGGAGGSRDGDRHKEAAKHDGLPPHEFVHACERAGATHAIFCRDLYQAWYLRGTPQNPRGGWNAVLEALEAEMEALKPGRLITLGASMGGYAAIRAGLALGADVAVAFSPQVLVDSSQREAAELPRMPFDDGLKVLKRSLWVEGHSMTSLVDVVREQSASGKCRRDQGATATAIEVHVGSNESGDVREARLLKDAVTALGSPGPVSITVVDHNGMDHNVVTSLRNQGALDAILRRLLGTGAKDSG